MTAATAPNKALDDLRRAWRPARARVYLGAAALLQAAAEEGRYNTRAQDIGVAWTEAFGAPAVPVPLSRELEFSVLALGVDRLGIIEGTFDPNDRSEREWWRNEDMLVRLREIAGQNGKRGRR